jgi:hypothetical protein
MSLFRSFIVVTLILSNVLPAGSTDTSAEENSTAEAISAEGLAPPTRITFPEEPLTLTQALHSMVEQSGYRVELDEYAKNYQQIHKVQKETVKIERLALWEAIDRVCSKFELTTKDVNREAIVLGIENRYEEQNPLMAASRSVGPFSVSIRLPNDVPRIFLRTEPAFVWPEITRYKMAMGLADGRAFEQAWPFPAGRGPWMNGATSIAFQPEGARQMEALRKSGAQIERFSVELELEVPVKWETQTLPAALSQWQAKSFQLGKTTFSVTDWGVKTNSVTFGGVTRPVYEPYIHLRATGPGIGRDPERPKAEDVRLRFEDGTVVKSSGLASSKFFGAENPGKQQRFYSVDLRDSRARQPRELNGNGVLEFFVPGEGYQKSPPLAEILPRKFPAGKTVLMLDPRNSSDNSVTIQSKPFIIEDVLVGFKKQGTMIEVKPSTMLAQEGSSQHFRLGETRPLENPDRWHPVVSVPTKTRKVRLNVAFDEVSWPQEEPQN